MLHVAVDDDHVLHVVSPEIGGETLDVFVGRVRRHLVDTYDGESSPRQLDVYAFETGEDLGRFLLGVPFETPRPVGRVGYFWPGDWMYLAADEDEPHPGPGWMAANAPVTEDDLDGYDLDDPKRITLQREIDG